MPILTTRTGSRLHFGLTAFGLSTPENSRRQYGGIGVMIENPELTLGFSAADRFQVTEKSGLGLADRIRQIAMRWLSARRHEGLTSLDLEDDILPATSISVIAAPPIHSGFGLGTQLALSVVAGLDRMLLERTAPLDETVEIADRGKRSAIGTYGFFQGGLIVDQGKLDHEPLSPLERHEHVPESWRFVIACVTANEGLSGGRERKAFQDVPPVPKTTTQWLRQEIHKELIPSVIENDFDRFAKSLWRYGKRAGACFEQVQGGCFNGPHVSSVVQTIRDLGFEGVGQSSWGPAVFTVTPDQQAAESLVSALNESTIRDGLQCWISRPRNRGIEMTIADQSESTSLERLA